MEERAVAERDRRQRRAENRRTVLPAQLEAWKKWWTEKHAGAEIGDVAPELAVESLSGKELRDCHLLRYGELPGKTNNQKFVRNRIVNKISEHFVRAPRLGRFERINSQIFEVFTSGRVPVDSGLLLPCGTLVGVHALILAARCADVFSGSPIQIATESDEVFVRRVVRALYNGKFDATTFDDAIRGMEIFREIGCIDQMSWCASFIADEIDETTVGRILLSTEGVAGLEDLNKRARAFLMRNYAACISGEEWATGELADIANSVALEKRAKRRRI